MDFAKHHNAMLICIQKYVIYEVSCGIVSVFKPIKSAIPKNHMPHNGCNFIPRMQVNLCDC